MIRATGALLREKKSMTLVPYYKSVISQCKSETISLRWSIKIKIARDAQTHLVKYKITKMQALKLSWVGIYLLSTQHRDNRWCHSTYDAKLYK